MNESLNDCRTALYRFFDAAGSLLYVGITNCVPRRLDQHHERKDWAHRVANVKVEHFPTRDAARDAERIAVGAERPEFNIRLQRQRRSVARAAKVVPIRGAGRGEDRARVDDQGGRWMFRSREVDFTRFVDLYLYPELDCSAMVGELDTDDGDEQFEEYVAYIQRRYPDWWAADQVPIVWCVEGARGFKVEFAPYGMLAWPDKRPFSEDFLTFYTWPEDRHTGEPLDWFRLPVRNDRFPEFAKALAWTPSPLQPFAPLRSIVENRRQHYRFYTPRSRALYGTATPGAA